MALEAGVEIEAAQRAAGHGSAAMTEHYNHSQVAGRQVTDLLPSLVEPEKGEPSRKQDGRRQLTYDGQGGPVREGLTSGVGEGYEGAEALVARREEGVAAGGGRPPPRAMELRTRPARPTTATGAKAEGTR